MVCTPRPAHERRAHLLDDCLLRLRGPRRIHACFSLLGLHHQPALDVDAISSDPTSCTAERRAASRPTYAIESSTRASCKGTLSPARTEHKRLEEHVKIPVMIHSRDSQSTLQNRWGTPHSLTLADTVERAMDTDVRLSIIL